MKYAACSMLCSMLCSILCSMQHAACSKQHAVCRMKNAECRENSAECRKQKAECTAQSMKLCARSMEHTHACVPMVLSVVALSQVLGIMYSLLLLNPSKLGLAISIPSMLKFVSFCLRQKPQAQEKDACRMQNTEKQKRFQPSDSTLHTAHCTLLNAHCALHTAHCTLHTAHCPL